jgi:hypothetical protein
MDNAYQEKRNRPKRSSSCLPKASNDIAGVSEDVVLLFLRLGRHGE